MWTAAIKTTFAVCEIHYSKTHKYSIAETDTSEYLERPYPSSTTDTTTTTNRHQLDYVRERYECPIDLLEDGIIIADSPGLNKQRTVKMHIWTWEIDACNMEYHIFVSIHY